MGGTNCVGGLVGEITGSLGNEGGTNEPVGAGKDVCLVGAWNDCDGLGGNVGGTNVGDLGIAYVGGENATEGNDIGAGVAYLVGDLGGTNVTLGSRDVVRV